MKDSNAPSSVRGSFLGWSYRTLSSLLVFAALGGLMWWGHQSDWTLPRWSALTGQAAAEKEDWCSAHSVPESLCVECKSALMPRPKAFGWCAKHGIHECPLCHPEVAQTKAPPKITASDLARAQRALDAADRPVNSEKCKLHERRIQFTSDEAAQKAGIDEEPVQTAPMVETLKGSGELGYDQTRTARVSARVGGSVFRVFKEVGGVVKQGEIVALVDAAEVGRAKSELCQALAQLRLRTKNFEALSAAARTGAVSDRLYREGETAVNEARIRLIASQQALTNLGLPVALEPMKALTDEELAARLQFLGLPGPLATTFDPRTTTGNLLPVIAPFDGVVVAREVVAGEVVDSNKVLFVVVDLRQMWLTLDLRGEDARYVALGQEVRFLPDGGREEVRGTITWISTEVDHKTRTLKVRAALANADGRLRANTFGAGRIILRDEPEVVVVRNEAVHWEGDCYVVFVRDKHYLEKGSLKVFHTRTVRVGVKDDTWTEIIAGVVPGEVVVTKGSGVLKAELLRGNLGEG